MRINNPRFAYIVCGVPCATKTADHTPPDFHVPNVNTGNLAKSLKT